MISDMKKILTFYIIAIFIFSCEEESTQNELILRVKENKTSCTGYEGQTECYLVQQGSKIDSDDWEYFYEQIEGFVYEPGFVYKISVAKETIVNPPIDSPSVKYSLIRELSKEPK
jgi:heat shock protein HslJ